MLLGDLAADVQPQAQPAVSAVVGVAAAMESFEKDRQVAVGNTDAAIRDGELRGTVTGPDANLDRIDGIGIFARPPMP